MKFPAILGVRDTLHERSPTPNRVFNDRISPSKKEEFYRGWCSMTSLTIGISSSSRLSDDWWWPRGKWGNCNFSHCFPLTKTRIVSFLDFVFPCFKKTCSVSVFDVGFQSQCFWKSRRDQSRKSIPLTLNPGPLKRGKTSLKQSAS